MLLLQQHFLFIVLCSLSIVCAFNSRIDPTTVPSDVNAGFLHGRSGHIVVKSLSENQAQDKGVFFVDELNQYIKRQDSMSFDATHVADVITRTLGVEPINADYQPSFLQSDIFHNARANALFSFESFSTAMIHQFSLENLRRLRTHGASFQLSYPVFPQQALPLSTSLATGKLPSQHGIVSKSWQKSDGRTLAFVTEGSKAAPLTANVADILQQTFEGVPLTISTSSNPQQAFAYCPNFALMTAHPDWNQLCLSQDPEAESVSAMGPQAKTEAKRALENALTCTRQKLLIDLSDPRVSVLADLTGVNAEVDGNQVTASYQKNGQTKTVTFDLTNQEDRALFMELQYAHTLMGRLQVMGSLNALVTDNVPDFYALTFASLTGVVDRYGHNSPQVEGACRVMDAVLPKYLHSLQALYPQRLVSEVVLMGSQSAVGDEDVLAAINDIAEQKNAADFYPNIYVNSPNTRLATVCEKMAEKLNERNVGVYCPDVAIFTLQAFHLQASDNSTNSTAPTDDEIQTYQIEFWFAIGWTFILFWIIYVLGWMGFKKDTLLYSTFNPNWEDRKRR